MDERTLNKKLKFIENYKKAINAASGSEKDANANVTTKNIATLSSELGKPEFIDVGRAIIKEYLESDELRLSFDEDLKNHVIYVNDETSIMPYCVAVSLYPFLLDGLKKLGGTSGPPKHANSFVGGLCNLVFLIAGQFAGAVAIPEFLPYLDHFLRVDFGNDYIKHLDQPAWMIGNNSYTVRHVIEDLFQEFVYCINQPAGARGYQSPFTNIAYFDKGYFNSIFKDFFFPDGDEPCYETTAELQKLFMKWFNKERLKDVITFPVETMNLLWDKDTHQYVDKDMADFTAEMWSEGHSFFLYNSDSADALSSCCFSKDQKVLARSCCRGRSKIYFDTFEHIGKTKDGKDRNTFEVYHNGSWCHGKKIKLSNRPMFKITTANKKEIVVSDNHLNPTLRGDISTTGLTIDDYLLFNIRSLEAVPEQDLKLTYEQGFAVGAFLGDGSFGQTRTLASGETKIYDVNYSQNSVKYAKCIDMVNKAVVQLGDDGTCRLNAIQNNVYPVRVCSEKLVEFIKYWTNWTRGTYAYNKELNLDCLLQSIDFRRGILDGWYNTDGGNSNRCYTCSAKLAEDMEVLCTSLGLTTVVDKVERTEESYIRGNLINHNYPTYTVRWYTPKQRRTMKNIYKVVNNSIYFKITSIEPVDYTEDIYCFEMENQDEPYFTLPNGIITHNCRLKNAIEENVFSYTLGAGGIETGSKKVITLNLNRIVQNWFNEEVNKKYKRNRKTLPEYIANITSRVHKYLGAWNNYLWDMYNANLLTVYNAGFIELDKQYLTVGVNGFIEGAEFLALMNEYIPEQYKNMAILPDNKAYQQYAKDILGTIKELNTTARTEHVKLNTECIPAENAAAKLYAWDKKDGYWVPECRNLYNSYFFPVESPNYDVLTKMYLHGTNFIGNLDGGSACHINLAEHLSKEQYRKLMDVAVDAGCSYFTFNIPNTICNDCGHISKHRLTQCDCCGSTNLDYATRIIGYLRRISNFSAPRQVEADARYYDDKEQHD